MKAFVIPAIDVKGGKLVRLLRGEFEKSTVYDEKPEVWAARFDELGFKRLHLVDLDGAKEGKPVNLETLRRVRRAFGGLLQVGGGIRSFESARTLFEEGADLVVVGTLAVKNPAEFEKILEAFPGRVVLAVDAKGGRVAVGGWREESSLTPEELAVRFDSKPVWGYLYTLVERDGTLGGVDVKPYGRFKRVTSKPVLASGGVASKEDLVKLKPVVDGVVVGRAIYEGRINLEEL
ncbi:MAG: 1-(5-phosphoribosyl)-5-[(5-phosphoribosylamino)methylideneamino]imidazole-4-carboxamide isomerase [Aquificae bacterium]|nr:1-(5-phosphoribosyl)-5-[(5-phosphoribosylamino)methylideneamino]imidazole-4-carboxamide isomerase [Aquificota bacterium]